MKYLWMGLMSLVVLSACKNESKEQVVEAEATVTEKAAEAGFELYGEDFEVGSAYEMDVIAAKFEKMNVTDTINVTLKGKVNSVCQKKGCWMRVDMGNEQEVFVKFKDYGFFVPMDMEEGTEIYMTGIAYKEMTSVEDLKHLAEDAGKPQAEIDAITEPEEVYSFLSSGVKIPTKS